MDRSNSMSPPPPTLHLVCGKAAAGKSTLTAALGQGAQTVVLSEDDWLSALYADQMTTLGDYLHISAKLRAAMTPHIVALLRAGLSVVLDFAANTVETRHWMRSLIDAADVAHVLHYLDVPDDVCLARLRARNARGDHPFAVTDVEFERLAKHFVPPSEDEGFTIVRHTYE